MAKGRTPEHESEALQNFRAALIVSDLANAAHQAVLTLDFGPIAEEAARFLLEACKKRAQEAQAKLNRAEAPNISRIKTDVAQLSTIRHRYAKEIIETVDDWSIPGIRTRAASEGLSDKEIYLLEKTAIPLRRRMGASEAASLSAELARAYTKSTPVAPSPAAIPTPSRETKRLIAEVEPHRLEAERLSHTIPEAMLRMREELRTANARVAELEASLRETEAARGRAQPPSAAHLSAREVREALERERQDLGILSTALEATAPQMAARLAAAEGRASELERTLAAAEAKAAEAESRETRAAADLDETTRRLSIIQGNLEKLEHEKVRTAQQAAADAAAAKAETERKRTADEAAARNRYRTEKAATDAAAEESMRAAAEAARATAIAERETARKATEETRKVVAGLLSNLEVRKLIEKDIQRVMERLSTGNINSSTAGGIIDKTFSTTLASFDNVSLNDVLAKANIQVTSSLKSDLVKILSTDPEWKRSAKSFGRSMTSETAAKVAGIVVTLAVSTAVVCVCAGLIPAATFGVGAFALYMAKVTELAVGGSRIAQGFVGGSVGSIGVVLGTKAVSSIVGGVMRAANHKLRSDPQKAAEAVTQAIATALGPQQGRR